MESGKTCPCCGENNNCAVSSASCWCREVTIPAELLELLAKEMQGRGCLCRNCLELYRQSPRNFLSSLKIK